jgi:hypothetical protein
MDDNEGKILSFAEREGGVSKHGKESPGGDDGQRHEAIAPGDSFATVTGQRRADELEFRMIDGHSFVVPYSYRPLLWWTPPDGLVIEYPTLFSVALRGRNIAGLYARIRDHRVTWIQEIAEEQAAALAAAVFSIEIIHAYPSRAGR